MFKKILLVAAVLIGGFLVVVALQPADFRVTRSATVDAGPAAAFAQVNDFHKWQTWSPWAKLDPTAKNSFSGPASGVGSQFSWDGNHEVGKGTMTVVEEKPNELVKIKLEFLEPFAATHTADFTFQSQGERTLVTWSMYGKNNFLGKAIGLFMDCDKMIGPMFEKGLAGIKSQAETTGVAQP